MKLMVPDRSRFACSAHNHQLYLTFDQSITNASYPASIKNVQRSAIEVARKTIKEAQNIKENQNIREAVEKNIEVSVPFVSS